MKCGDTLIDVKKFLFDFLKLDDVIVVGCSGGPDSMALMDILLKFRKKYKLKLICAHVNHNVREESYDEMLFVEKYCLDNDIVFEKMTITNYGDDNFENEARNIRYDFFDKLIKKYSANYLMTAHHGDDLIETVLMRIVRGSNLTGYKGFSMIVDRSDYKIVRPLVFTTKEEIEKYNEENDISFVIDKTNFMDVHTRNRYRKVVLPFLKEEDKNVHLKFLKYSKVLKQYDDFINKVIKDIVSKVLINNKIDIVEFLKLEEIIQVKIIYYIFEKFYSDDLILLSDAHIDLILKLIKSNKSNGYIYLPNNIRAIKSYNYLEIIKEIDLIDSYDIEIEDLVFLPNGKNIEKLDYSDINNNNFCRLSSSDVSLPLHVRTRKNGDKIKIKNMKGYRKINDIFIDCKVPMKDRDLWPVVIDSKDNIVWLPGLKKSCFDRPKNEDCDIILKYY